LQVQRISIALQGEITSLSRARAHISTLAGGAHDVGDQAAREPRAAAKRSDKRRVVLSLIVL
jgi:hypothetical protein